jgi:hypothetical protein
MRAVIANLPEKTGKSLADWLAILKKSGPGDPKEQVKWLKSVHDVGHVTAQCIVASAQGKGDEYESPNRLLDNLFKGSPVFREIYEKVLAEIKALPDTEVKPCKTYVPFVHRIQFARIKPVGKSHLELLLALGDERATDRLTVVKARAGRLSRAVQLRAPKDVDAEVRKWLKKAHAAVG